ncbi:MAG TPA: hypothetical protein VGQ31_10720 [Candidatus Limnocylindrales bacterium]|nr:hypothetical protein [Candidatus Limnocylindrales bacterium]
MRRYVGLDASLVDDLSANATAICRALTSAPGARDCDVIATRDGLLVLALGDDEAAVVESGRRFAAWLERHLPDVHETNPEVWSGVVIAHGMAASPAEGGRS